MKRFHEISFNDYKGGISVLLVIPSCSVNCEYCFNKNIWKVEIPDFVVYKEIIDKYKKKIKHFVLGGGDICDKRNREIVRRICIYLQENNLGIHLQINAKTLKDSMSFLRSMPFDSVRLNLNNICPKDVQYVNELYTFCDDITTSLIFVSDNIGVPREIEVDELVVDYNNPKLYNRARDYARQKEIPVLVSSQYGKEDI